MAYIDILKENYNYIFEISRQALDGFQSMPIVFSVYGRHDARSKEKISEMIEKLYKEHLMYYESDSNNTECVGIITYKTNKSERHTEISCNDWLKINKYLLDKNAVYIHLLKSEKELDRYNNVMGCTIGEIRYIDYSLLFSGSHEFGYCIEFRFEHVFFARMNQEKKDELINFFKSMFCRLNAANMFVTYYNNYSEYERYSTRKYIEDIEELLPGCYWCNMISGNQIDKLGGSEKIKEALNQFIVEEHTKENGQQALYIQLTKDDETMTREQLVILRDLFMPILMPVSRKTYSLSKNQLDNISDEAPITAINAKIQAVKKMEFVFENIILIDNNDPRWT